VYAISSWKRCWTSIVECISPEGKQLDPGLIFREKHVQQNCFLRRICLNLLTSISKHRKIDGYLLNCFIMAQRGVYPKKQCRYTLLTLVTCWWPWYHDSSQINSRLNAFATISTSCFYQPTRLMWYKPWIYPSFLLCKLPTNIRLANSSFRRIPAPLANSIVISKQEKMSLLLRRSKLDGAQQYLAPQYA